MILDTPIEGDITLRAFTYPSHFLFIAWQMIDYNFLILYDDDGVPYARLLSERVTRFNDVWDLHFGHIEW